MAISAEQVKALREKTGAGIAACKAALEETAGDMEKANEVLRKKGLASAEGKSGRATGAGWIGSYIHNGRVGVMVELACETDFVAKNDVFQAYLKDLCMHVASGDPPPIAVRREDVPESVLAKEREILLGSDEVKKKPENMRAKIVEGKLGRFLPDRCLLEQKWFKDQNRTVADLLKDLIAKTGENMIVKRFARWTLGE
ncbi:MAG: elongation factor Ts [Planctomycetes bacterium]|nr:elongation factor Ts [Planctomycetota bacterium]